MFSIERSKLQIKSDKQKTLKVRLEARQRVAGYSIGTNLLKKTNCNSIEKLIRVKKIKID